MNKEQLFEEIDEIISEYHGFDKGLLDEKSENLVKEAIDKLLSMHAVGSCLPTSNDRILELKEAIIRWDLKNEINDRQAFTCGWNNCYRWIKDFVRQQR